MLWLATLLHLIFAAAQPTCPQEPAQVVKSIGTCTSDIQRHQTGAATYTRTITSNGPFIIIGALESPVVSQEAFEHYQCGIDCILEKNHYPAVPGEVGWRRKVEPKQKPLLHIHIHNDAGTTVCLAAYMNGEHVVQPNENCNWAKFDHIWRRHHHNASYVTGIGSTSFHPPSCEDRAEYFAKHGFTFGAIEREVHAGDYCPKQFRYSIVLRHPILSLKSYLTAQSTELHYVENSAIAYGFHKFQRCGVSVIDCNLKTWLPRLINAIRSKTPSPGMNGGDITPVDGPGFFGWKLIDNYKIRSIVGEVYNSEPGSIGPEHLQKAIDLLSKFDYVKTLGRGGTRQFWNASAPKLCWHQGMTKGAHSGTHNQGLSGFSNGTTWKKDLLELNKYDIQLFDHFDKLQ